MTNNTKTQAIKRYVRVKNHVKNTMVSSDLNEYVQQLIQADRIQSQLINQIAA